ncbi:MAG: ribosome small subunit-dependent GTPase A [Pseudomonadota bacterium]
MKATTQTPGRVVANYGRRVLIQDTAGNRHLCIPKGRKLGIVCGDQALWRPAQQSEDLGVVEQVLPRSTTLERPNTRGRVEVLAANITQLLIVICHKPPLDPYLVDRYIVAAELMGIKSRILWNKVDLLDHDTKSVFGNTLEEFQAIGYDILEISAKQKVGLKRLAEVLRNETSILVGQSGVGKSSLLNALIPNIDVATKEISEANKEGKHTTTTAVWYDLAISGSIIDSPGIRDYTPAPVEQSKIAIGFREFDSAPPCRFNNCSHLREPGCGVQEWVEKGLISERRFESYRRLCNIMNKLQSRT